jgi:uncharacterized membrane protein
MSGDARRRFCNHCQLNVYNFAEMTSAEVQKLIAESEGRICGRLYKRADGTVLTKDCPVGLRAYQKRVARFAGAALTAVLGLFSISFGQKNDKTKLDASKITIDKTVDQSRKGSLSVVVYDPNGAVVPNAAITIYKSDEKKKATTSMTDGSGTYEYSSLEDGNYTLKITAGGFKATMVNIEIKDGEKSQVKVSLEPGNKYVEVMGVIAGEAFINPTSSSLQTTITKDMMNRLPH